MALHPVVRRTLRLLGAGYALAWLTISMVVGPGSAALVALSGRAEAAGMFIALYYLAAAAGALAGGRAMDLLGRRPVLVGAHASAAAGFAVAGVGFGASSLAVFVAGTVLLAAAMGAVLLTRLAAAELFPPALRGRGMGWVLVSATAGAIGGPLLLVASVPLGALLGRDPMGLVWFLAPPLLLLAAGLVALASEPMAIARDLSRYHPGAPPAPAAGPAAHRRATTAGFAVLAFAQAAMGMVMGVAGAAVAHAGHAVGTLGAVMALHFLGMFGLSTLVGRAADRWGRRRTVLAGLGLLAVGGMGVAAVPSVAGFGAGLAVMGLGWSLAYLGATALLTDATPLPRRARVIGRADLAAALAAAGAAALGGWWWAGQGALGLGLAAVALAAFPAVLVSSLREERPGIYAAGATRTTVGEQEAAP